MAGGYPDDTQLKSLPEIFRQAFKKVIIPDPLHRRLCRADCRAHQLYRCLCHCFSGDGANHKVPPFAYPYVPFPFPTCPPPSFYDLRLIVKASDKEHYTKEELLDLFDTIAAAKDQE